MVRLASLALALAFMLALGLAQPAWADDYVVNRTDDSRDGTCDAHCSLYDAITEANTNPGSDTITFDGALSGQTVVITSTTSGLTIQGANADGTIIDGDINGDRVADVTLSYGGTGDGISGLRLRSSNNVIQNLLIQGFTGYGIYLQSYSGGTNFEVNDNLISNTVVISNAFYGIYVKEDPDGGNADGNRILLSRMAGNDSYGIAVTGASNTEILTNVIGLDATGAAAQPNALDGLWLNGALDATIRANTISGNGRNGILISGGAAGNVIAGNKIGVDASGTIALPNGTGYSFGRDGIQCYGDGGGGYDNVIGGTDPADANIIAGNTRAGIFLDGYACYDNEIYGNYIGTNPAGADLGNGSLIYGGDQGDAGVQIEDGAHGNIIGGLATGQANVIRFNLHGVRFSGVNGPPQDNWLIGNTIVGSDLDGVVNQLTHRNTFSTTGALGDNLIARNVISGNARMGMFNWGASPFILTNTIVHNGDFGIANRVYFETNHADDLLAMPHIYSNTLDANANDDIFSRDTAPLNKDTLHEDNDFGTTGGDARVSQRWFGAVEVISGTTTLDASSSLTVTVSTFAAPRTPCPGGAADCIGADYDAVNATQGIWGPTGIDYDDIELVGGYTSWFELREYEVEADGSVITYSKMLVTVEGERIGSAIFSFDGISTTEPVDPDYQLLFCENTGILTDPAHSSCRYQLAQVLVEPLGGDGDADGDGIPDEVEGTDDADGDGTPNYQDTDSDGDGIPDDVEGEGDADGDGTPNYLDTDSDGDGIPDEVEGQGDADGDGIPDYLESNTDDADGDGTPNYMDTDSDGDGISDEDEYDQDGDGVADDADGDGIPDYLESNTDDADGDGTPNYQDEDSDGDGIPDSEEWGTADCPDDDNAPFCDADDDGIPDYLESNTDDADGDGTPNYMDEDSDGDGIPDSEEWGTANCPDDDNAPACDADDDGIPDYLESDTSDVDGDGIPNAQDTDSDGDGIPDSEEWGTANCPDDDNAPACDADGDGIPDYLESDVRDTDGDGTPDSEDTDADGDGIPDSEEWGMANCPDDDNAPACDTDGDSVPDWLENNLAPDEDAPPDYGTDPNANGVPPNQENDSDSDGIPDGTEFYPQCEAGAEQIDTDNDGIPNCADWDADGDGVPNFLDTDSDNDGIPDSEEGTADANGNGVPDYLDPAEEEGDTFIYLPIVFRSY